MFNRVDKILSVILEVLSMITSPLNLHEIKSDVFITGMTIMIKLKLIYI